MTLSVNGQIPGPPIVVDWGDTVGMILVHATNQLTANGTSLHFHGIRQLNTNQMDGVGSVTQCPTAPGYTTTYTWKATQYGTSWYHSHFGLQAWNGVHGGIQINGPATAHYDADLGHMLLGDWTHITADAKFAVAQYQAQKPALDNGLINGKNVYNNSGKIVGSRYETSVQRGKTYRIRLVNTAIDTHYQYSIDGHDLTVIANDLVPIKPYTTKVLNIAVGQRYDVLITANQPSSNYWIRALPQECSGASGDNIRAILRYNAASTADPTTSAHSTTVGACVDEAPSKLVPYLSKDVPKDDAEAVLTAAIRGSPFRWYMNGITLKNDWANPTLQEIAIGNTTFGKSELVTVLSKDEWYYLIIESPQPIAHPMHLHGHDFYVLAAGTGRFSLKSTSLQTTNPPRRDVALLPSGGYLVIAWKADNPGAWLLHCHVGWHSAAGFALQYVEQLPVIKSQIDVTTLTSTCDAWNAYTKNTGYDTTTDVSGI